VELLLSAPSHPAQADCQGGRALQLAVLRGSVALAELLLGARLQGAWERERSERWASMHGSCLAAARANHSPANGSPMGQLREQRRLKQWATMLAEWRASNLQ